MVKRRLIRLFKQLWSPHCVLGHFITCRISVEKLFYFRFGCHFFKFTQPICHKIGPSSCQICFIQFFHVLITISLYSLFISVADCMCILVSTLTAASNKVIFLFQRISICFNFAPFLLLLLHFQ